MSKLNILHVILTDKFSGAEKVLEQICVNINKEKYNVFVMCAGGELLERYKKNKIKVYEFNINKSKIKYFLRYINFIKSNKINIIHAHGMRASLIALIIKTLFKRNFKLISHVHECSKWLKSKNILRFVDRIVRNMFDYNILCGKKVFEDYLMFGSYIDKSKVRVISNAIEFKKVDTVHNEVLARKYRKDIDFVFGFIGRLSKPKGMIPFISRLVEKSELLENARILLVGDGEEVPIIKEIIASKSLEEKIIFTGYKDNIYDYLTVFDLFLLPSLTEGLPMVLLEAMLMKTPALCFNVGSIRELIDDGVNGYLIRPEDYTTFFEYMERLKNEKGILRCVGEKARQKIIREYSLPRYIEEIENLYGSIG